VRCGTFTPANARVEDVEIRNEKFIGEFSKFDVLY
jgi:acylphosphatase